MTTLEAVIARAEAVLLDFDGPVCSLFAGRPNYVVAGRMRQHLEEASVVLPPRFADNRDPLKLLQWVGAAHPQLVSELDGILTEEETVAAETAQPTAGAHDAIRRFAWAGLPVAIVSNNSAQAVTTYLDLHRLLPLIGAIAGRLHGEPARMKPEPDAPVTAMGALDTPAEACIFIGDAPTDVQAAQAAGVVSVGYAKSDRHRTALVDAGADLIIDNMGALAAVLEAA